MLLISSFAIMEQRKFKVQRDLPLIVGRDVVGTVEAIGLDVKCFQVGDEVAGMCGASQKFLYIRFEQ